MHQNKYCLDLQEYKEKAKVPLEHMVDCHIYCVSKFCPVINQPEHNFEGKYCCKSTDRKLYCYLNAIYSQFTTDEKLLQMMHSLDSQVNESLNTAISFRCPKNKNYSRTFSLSTPVFTAAAIHVVGYHDFYVVNFSALKIEPGLATIKM